MKAMLPATMGITIALLLEYFSRTASRVSSKANRQTQGQARRTWDGHSVSNELLQDLVGRQNTESLLNHR